MTSLQHRRVKRAAIREAVKGNRRAAGRLIQGLEDLLELRADPRPWIEANLWIRTKGREVVPFHFNWAQSDYYAHRTLADIILKPRQLGFTTLISALFFADCLLRPNTASVIVAHDFDSTERIFRIIKLFFEHLPEEEKAEAGQPQYESRREFYWPKIGSSYFVGTAGSLRFGHGLTISNLHCSEVSRWTHPEESLVGLLEAVPAGGRVVLESTAYGVGNHFHDLWIDAKAGRNRFRSQFYVWFEDPTYAIPGPALSVLTEDELALKQRWKLSDDQIRWRREKQRELRVRFPEQYPEDDGSCFLTTGRCCFDMAALLKQQRRAAGLSFERVATLAGRKGSSVAVAPARLLVWAKPEKGARYVIGADIAEGLEGRDASAACVLERKSGRQVAELHGWVSPERFAHLLDALGRWYNVASVGVERNNHGHSTLNTLRNVCRYPQLYRYVRYDAGSRSQTATLGWPTDAQTKPILVDDLAAAIANGHVAFSSSALLDECRTFVTTDTGAQQAQRSKRDDRVMAAGIAWQVRKRGGARASGQRPAGW